MKTADDKDMKNEKRTHDEFYLKEDYKTKPKEYFKFVLKLLKKVDEGIETIKANIAKKDSLPRKDYDIVSMLGVIGIFDDMEDVLDIDIPKHEDDPLRSWTVPMADGRRMVMNGLQLIHSFYLIKIKK